jgi:formylglycine-generating enzyme required for sulfatase activity
MDCMTWQATSLVAEWVQDWYNPNYCNDAPLSDPQGPPHGAIKAMRGESWLKPAISLRTSDRDWGTMDSRPVGPAFAARKTPCRPSSHK